MLDKILQVLPAFGWGLTGDKGSFLLFALRIYNPIKTDGISTLTAQSLLAITGNLAFFLFLPSLKQRNPNPTDPGPNLKQRRFLTSLGLSVRSLVIFAKENAFTEGAS